MQESAVMIIYLIGHNLNNVEIPRQHAGNTRYQEIHVPATMSVPGIIEAIIAATAWARDPQLPWSMQRPNAMHSPQPHQRSIWWLRILAHGEAGVLQLGTGLNEGNVSGFTRLRPYMTPAGRGVAIYGCRVASAERGRAELPSDYRRRITSRGRLGAGWRFLKALATALDQPVRAGAQLQYGGAAGTHQSHDTWELDGPNVQVYPNGRTIEYARPRPSRGDWQPSADYTP
jgi:hypothetical protein